MYYTPQVLGIHTNIARQNFRRGSCSPYPNPLLLDSPNVAFPPVLIKRFTSGAAATVLLYRTNGTFVCSMTPASETNYALDGEGEYEMLVLGGGDWAGFAPALNVGTMCYLQIDSGGNTYYTDEFLLEENTDGFPPDCGENWAYLTWSLGGACIFSDTVTANAAEPVSAYPITPTVHTLHWQANLSRPEWEYDESGEPDAHGTVVVDTKRLAKRWVLEGVPVTETIADALTAAALSDAVSISFRDGTVFQDITDIRVEVEWEQGGCAAIVKMKFTTDYLVKQGCC